VRNEKILVDEIEQKPKPIFKSSRIFLVGIKKLTLLLNLSIFAIYIIKLMTEQKTNKKLIYFLRQYSNKETQST
jgi:hypothetical protein